MRSDHSSNTIHPNLDRLNQQQGRFPPSPASTAAHNSRRRRQEAERKALRQKQRLDLLRQQNELKRHKEFLEKSKVWEEQILPHWEEMVMRPKVRDLCLKGIPPTVRAKVWPLLIGNDLEVDEELFDGLIQEVYQLFGEKLSAQRTKRSSYSFSSSVSYDSQAATKEEATAAAGLSLLLARNHPQEEAQLALQQQQEEEHSADIPIPRLAITSTSSSFSYAHLPPRGRLDSRQLGDEQEDGGGEVNITDMSWFENERSGSLTQQSFDLVQRQMLDRPNYLLLQKALLSAHSQNSYLSHSISQANPPPETGNNDEKARGCSVDSVTYSSNACSPPPPVAPLSGRYDPNLSTPFLFDDGVDEDGEEGGRRSPVPPRPGVHFEHSTPQKLGQSEDLQAEEDGDGFLVGSFVEEGGEYMPFTPPRREKHDTSYLIHAGLLVEATNALPPTPATPSRLQEEEVEVPEERQHRVVPLKSQTSFLWQHRNVSSELTNQIAHLAQQEEEENGEPEDGETKREETVSDELNEALLPLEYKKLRAAVSLIEWDLPRTFPVLAFFHDGGPMHTGMERILLCYALFKPAIGYVQGMSFLVATLLLCMDEFEAFKCFANLMNRRISQDFYCLRKDSIDAYVRCFDHYFKKLLPLLFNHLRAEGVTSEMFLMDWNLSLFTKALPLEIAAQVWDGYLYEGESYILCVGLGILKMFAAVLSTFTFERITPFLLHLPEDIKAEELFQNIAQINISKKNYEKIRRKMIGPEQPIPTYGYRSSTTISATPALSVGGGGGGGGGLDSHHHLGERSPSTASSSSPTSSSHLSPTNHLSVNRAAKSGLSEMKNVLLKKIVPSFPPPPSTTAPPSLLLPPSAEQPPPPATSSVSAIFNTVLRKSQSANDLKESAIASTGEVVAVAGGGGAESPKPSSSRESGEVLAVPLSPSAMRRRSNSTSHPSSSASSSIAGSGKIGNGSSSTAQRRRASHTMGTTSSSSSTKNKECSMC